MAVENNFTSSLFAKLKIEDPWLPPTTWESFPVPQTTPRRGLPITSPPPPPPPFLTPSVSEASLVRLALNSLEGVESAILSIEKLSSTFCSVSADRTFHGNPSLWNRSSSTHSLGRILKCIGCSGSLVFLLRKFVEFFKDVKLVGDGVNSGYSLVNQAFAVAVEKVLEAYICGLDTLCASVGLRRGSSPSAMSVDNEAPSYVCETEPACFGSVVSHEVTLLEVYLHTKELRTQIQSLGNVCKLCDTANCFAVTCTFEKLVSKAKFEFSKFYRGGDLLSYLYSQLQVADCAHLALLKFLFLRSCEPYCRFIRSWMFKAEISDPFKEFVVECADNKPFHLHSKVGNPVDFSLASVKDDVAVPCFLKDIFIPIVRAGQQLQVLKKLLELCNLIGPADYSFEDLLPRWSEYSSDHSLSASPIAFSKGYLQTLVTARNNYYIKMQERLENLLIKLEFRYPEAVLHSNFTMVLDDRRKNSKSIDLFMLGDGLFANSTNDIWDSNMDVANTKSDCSESEHEHDVFDTFESSECSSLSDSEEQTKAEQLIGPPDRSAEDDQSYLLSLHFSMTGSSDGALKKPAERENPHAVKRNLHESYEKNDAFDHFHFYDKNMTTTNIYMPLGTQELNWSSMSDTQNKDLKGRQLAIPNSPFSYDRGHSLFQELDQSNSAIEMRKTTSSFLNKYPPYLPNMPSTTGALIEKTLGGNQFENETYIPTLFSLQPWKDCSLLSANPMLRRNRFFHTKMAGGKCCRSYAKSLRCFDFSTVEDPFRVSEHLLAANLSRQTGSLGGPFKATPATSCKSYDKDDQDGNDASTHNPAASSTHSPLDLKENGQKDDVLTNCFGGNGWETLLGSFCYAEHKTIGDHRMSLSSAVEIPLDFVVDKCLVQEILLQYKYVSRLAIKLLEEGFDLQEHLLALRRYYFMESSDWADLFIMSLWHHKWSVAEADQRVPEIQGLLELAVQRSSCEWDPNKDRLFVFIKGNRNDNMPLSTSAIGVHSFDFLGLGYRVDWPVNIVLTSRAMKIYVEIFSFLIQVKLAVFSLTDIWCSLKELMPLISKYRHSKTHDREVGHFNILMRMRHQLSHFVSTLQQYVQSQLSLVSWCKFLHSLKYKVKDMMDLEPVHMAYLEDSLHICFLSDETRPVASIIETILQCAFEFRSCLTSSSWDVELDQGGLLGKLSRLNISQVLTIKQKFDKNLRELHLCYLKSPKHGGFGVPRFWGYLNYNGFYSDMGNKTGLNVFPV